MAQFYIPRRRQTEGKKLTVLVESLDTFGQGVAHQDGKALFIIDAVPGEKVDIVLTEDKKHYAKAKVIKRYNEGTGRVKPVCQYYTLCGGCQQQHIEIRLQQRSKVAALTNLIARETGELFSQPEVIADKPFHYRRRTRLSLQFQTKHNRLIMGFRQKASHEIVNITHCPILQQNLEVLLVPLFECLSSLQTVKKLGHVELVSADNAPIVILRHLTQLTENDKQCLLAFARQHQLMIYLALNDDKLEPLYQTALPSYQVEGLELNFSPQDFIQINARVNQKMIAQTLTWLTLTRADRVLDLFCGMGNFTLPLAKYAGEVIGVEGVSSLVSMAQTNARLNKLDNVTFYHCDLEQDISQQAWAKKGFNKVLIDPARAGAEYIMQHIVKLLPSHVVYVSCNPATLARDSKQLIKAGYRLVELKMLDMFPHTAHLESMALFIR